MTRGQVEKLAILMLQHAAILCYISRITLVITVMWYYTNTQELV